jgi:ADP-ribosylglycohydrolase
MSVALLAGARGERAVACLLGGAIGDGLGYEVEFKSLSEIRQCFGPAGIQIPVLHDGRLVVSDDTQMALFTLEGLLRAAATGADWEAACIASIREAYLDWYLTQQARRNTVAGNGIGWLMRQPVMCARRAPGNTCLAALGAGANGSMEAPINTSKGCGGVMRTAPVGLAGFADCAAAFRVGAQAAALTHGHPSGYLSAGMMASLVHLLVRDTPLTPSLQDGAAIEQSCRVLQTYAGHEETMRAIASAVQFAVDAPGDTASAIDKLGARWIGEEALAIAIYAVLSAPSFTQAVTLAANHSGDSDSTASIAGQLWGAAYGLTGIPHEWITALDVLIPLGHLGRQMISSWLQN